MAGTWWALPLGWFSGAGGQIAGGQPGRGRGTAALAAVWPLAAAGRAGTWVALLALGVLGGGLALGQRSPRVDALHAHGEQGANSMLGSVAWLKTGCPSTGCTGAEMKGSGGPASRRGADARSRLHALGGAASATAPSASHRELRVEVEAGLALQAPDAGVGCVRAEALRVG